MHTFKICVIATLMILILMQSAQADNWPMFRHDVAHTGVADEVVLPPLELLWKYKISEGYEFFLSPAVFGGIVYVGTSKDDYVYALDAKTGSLRWKYQTMDQISSSPTVSGDFVYIGSNDGYVYALDAEIGSLKWKYKVSSKIFSAPVISEGAIYFGSHNFSGRNYVYALDAKTGSLKWKYETYYAIDRSSPAVSGGTIYVVLSDGNLHALDISTGDFKWKYQLDGSLFVWSSPAVSGGIVYVGSWGGYMYALDAATGDLKWKYKTIGTEKQGRNEYTILSSPAVSGGVVYFGSNDDYVYARDANTGSLKWKYKTGSRVVSSPAISGGVVYIGSDDGYLYALDYKNGSSIWKYEFPPVKYAGESRSISSSPAVSDGVVYVTSENGYMYAFASNLSGQTVTSPESRTTPILTPITSQTPLEMNHGTFKYIVTVFLFMTGTILLISKIIVISSKNEYSIIEAIVRSCTIVAFIWALALGLFTIQNKNILLNLTISSFLFFLVVLVIFIKITLKHRKQL
jgi:outer membrane protein assembly factor BamB